MFLVIKSVLVLLGIIFVDNTALKAMSRNGSVPVGTASMITAISLIILFVLILKQVIKPVADLYDASRIINFDDDQIDCSKLDVMKVSGSKEVKLLIKKFKYLIDIIAERINKINSETYKSEHDGLSGCYNRIHLDTVKSNYEDANYCAILFIDVNNLKRMNDEYGHEAGDALIVSAAAKLSYWDNYGDVYRMGGDEFMIVILNKTPDTVQKMVNEWYPTVGQLNSDSQGFKCVLSWGLAFGEKGCNFDALEKEADDRMYEFKVAIKKKFGEPLR